MGAYYAMQWPRENLFCAGYIHKVMNFRYNWHETEYELNILLHGRAEYCRDGESWLLEEDMILIDPGVGHASFALESDTYALVLRVSASAFRASNSSSQSPSGRRSQPGRLSASQPHSRARRRTVSGSSTTRLR